MYNGRRAAVSDSDDRPRSPPRLAVVMAELGKGGMGKMRVHLMNALAERGLAVDLLLAKDQTKYKVSLHESIRRLRMPTTHAWFGIPWLRRYLVRERPDAMLTQRVRVNMLAQRALRLARVPTRIYTTGNTHLSSASDASPPAERARRLARIRRFVPRNDGLIAVSQGVADDIALIAGVPAERITVAPNPVVTPDLATNASAPVDHPWFATGEPPVILGTGRLSGQKDFPTLIRALAEFRREHRARLVILGKGPQRKEILACAHKAGIDEDFHLPGFVANPYAYMARARMFVLSSAWEGSPNALTEALALGVPVVSTDCPGGPREFLDGGRAAPLVPVGDAEALAEGMRRVWDTPPDTEALAARVRQRYSQVGAAQAYMAVMRLEPQE